MEIEELRWIAKEAGYKSANIKKSARLAEVAHAIGFKEGLVHAEKICSQLVKELFDEAKKAAASNNFRVVESHSFCMTLVSSLSDTIKHGDLFEFKELR